MYFLVLNNSLELISCFAQLATSEVTKPLYLVLKVIDSFSSRLFKWFALSFCCEEKTEALIKINFTG